MTWWTATTTRTNSAAHPGAGQRRRPPRVVSRAADRAWRPGCVLTAPGIPHAVHGAGVPRGQAMAQQPGPCRSADRLGRARDRAGDAGLPAIYHANWPGCGGATRPCAARDQPYYATTTTACSRSTAGSGRRSGCRRGVASANRRGRSTSWPFPQPGHWHEVFNSDAYDSLPPGGGYNPGAAGNTGGIDASGPRGTAWVSPRPSSFPQTPCSYLRETRATKTHSSRPGGFPEVVFLSRYQLRGRGFGRCTPPSGLPKAATPGFGRPILLRPPPWTSRPTSRETPSSAQG